MELENVFKSLIKFFLDCDTGKGSRFVQSKGDKNILF